MGKTINITAPGVLDAGSLIQLAVIITEGSTTISERWYSFDIREFSSIYDSYTPNIGVINFGNKQALTLSNGDYTTVKYDGSTATDIAALVSQLTAAMAAIVIT